MTRKQEATSRIKIPIGIYSNTTVGRHFKENLILFINMHFYYRPLFIALVFKVNLDGIFA